MAGKKGGGSEFCHRFGRRLGAGAALAYNEPMNRLLDKAIVLGCCLAAASGCAVDAGLVAALCVAVALSALVEAARPWARRPGAVAPLALAAAGLAAPQLVLFAPLSLYDVARGTRRGYVWPLAAASALLAVAAFAHVRAGSLAPRSAALVAALLSWRTSQLERERERMRRTRDELQERSLGLEEKNRDLLSRREYEVELATLAERARIAREIHDNVGHQLTRASLQAEALRVVHAGEPGIAADFADVKRTVDEALDMVRSSVHDLRDDSVDLGVQMRKVAGSLSGQAPLDVALDVSCEQVPANVSTCFLAVLRESLSNVARHSDATRVDVRCLEHPSFYQLVVEDNGGKKGDRAPEAASDGMGLSSMRERVEALGGSFAAGPAEDGGWRVFASVPKQQSRKEVRA